ncbi:MAG: hypothetical protein HS116_14570 [Planctomycetes bacterium]|nr:hypothetical protein [Planctomycetota bacterium]
MPASASPRPVTGTHETPRGITVRHPLMVTDAYIADLRAMRRERRARLAELKTPKDVRKYQECALEAIDRAFAPRPPKTPLKPRVYGTVEFPGVRVEKLTYESRPGVLVTANLWLPAHAGAARRVPGVVVPCGHSGDGKLSYFRIGQRLARAGFAAIIYDPYNQGERDQYYGLSGNLAERTRANCCFAHNMMGKQLELCGEFFGAWRAWDGIRALDFLLTRPEIDPACLGVTGNSGGGTLTTWLWATEPRFTMAAPSCFITGFLRNLENELPADNEQYPPGVVGAGLEHVDFLIARAPKPLLLLGQHFDYFDRRGLRDSHLELKRIQAILGAPSASHDLFIGPQGHGYSWHNQQRMIEFFHRHAGFKGKPIQLTDEELPDTIKPSLKVLPKGNTVAHGATPIYALIAARGLEQNAARKRKGAPAREGLMNAVRKVLAIEPEAGNRNGRQDPPHYRNHPPAHYGTYRGTCFAVETEFTDSHDAPGARICAFLHQPCEMFGHSLDLSERVTLWLPHVSAEAELNAPDLAGALIGKSALLALDVRGAGYSMPPDEDFFHPYGYDYMHHGYGLLFGRSYLGRRVFDVLRTLDLLSAQGVREVELIGRGQGALIAAYAALLCPDLVRKTTLHGAPTSYLSWATAPVVAWPASCMPRGVLKQFDLPDVYRALGARLRIASHWDEQMMSARPQRLKAAKARNGRKRQSA